MGGPRKNALPLSWVCCCAWCCLRHRGFVPHPRDPSPPQGSAPIPWICPHLRDSSPLQGSAPTPGICTQPRDLFPTPGICPHPKDLSPSQGSLPIPGICLHPRDPSPPQGSAPHPGGAGRPFGRSCGLGEPRRWGTGNAAEPLLPAPDSSALGGAFAKSPG